MRPGDGRPHRVCVKRGRESGFVFILAITALAVLLLLGGISIHIAMQSLDRATKQRNSAIAFDLAEAGADSGEAWLREQGSPPTGLLPLDPLGGTRTLDTGTYRATITPHPDNPGAWRKSFTIVGEGTAARGGTTGKVILQVKEQSFALYAYFTDQERSSVTNGTIWFYARDRIHGPAHSNDRFHIAWSSTSADPIFYGTVSSASASVDWRPSAPSTQQDWRRILQGGQDALTLGVDRIELPTMSDMQRDAAWGDSVGFPSTNGVYLPMAAGVTGGIFVRGDCQVQFSVGVSSGDQIISITQGTKTTTVTVDLDGNQITLSDGTPAGTHTHAGLPNGVLYCTGNITSLKGTLADNYQNGAQIVTRNAWTVATDVAAGKDITLTDSLKYQTEPMSDQPATYPNNLRAATLGLLADDIVVGSGCPSEMTIDGVILANGSFYYASWDTKKRSNLHILGGVIQRKRGPVGQFDSNNTLVSGYNKDYRYDIRMPDSPPPYFPTTGQYEVVSWQCK